MTNRNVRRIPFISIEHSIKTKPVHLNSIGFPSISIKWKFPMQTKTHVQSIKLSNFSMWGVNTNSMIKIGFNKRLLCHHHIRKLPNLIDELVWKTSLQCRKSLSTEIWIFWWKKKTFYFWTTKFRANDKSFFSKLFILSSCCRNIYQYIPIGKAFHTEHKLDHRILF